MRKAMMQDIAFWAIILMIFAVMILVGGRLNDDLTDHWQNSTALGTQAKDIQQSFSSRFVGIFDNAFLFVLVLFGISVVVVLYYISSQPSLFFVGIILLAIVALPIAILGNAFDDMTDSGELSTQAANMPITSWLMEHLLEIGIGFGFLGVILLFARTGGGY